MKIDSAQFVTSAKDLASCLVSDLPEFAFIGRSNVGKSSLINMLAGKKELAHTSSKPGKTQLINFFEINRAWHLVDLPGYGYAKVSKSKQHDFNRDISAYLTERTNLKHIFLLVDSQIDPQGGDLSFAQWLQKCELSYSIIFTKIDRSSSSHVFNHAQCFTKALSDWDLRPTKIFYCSAKISKGRGPLLQWIQQQLPKRSKKNKSGGLNLDWMSR
ncbi:MAG: YihA family ribosome biogenesis GTP-binding protein [Coraliomargarita sp.]|nr:YihA family ribosome biogenesis GTP-binding protein [Coraliomargarita sp.]|tara:strand:- start:66 stop:710 length:645 start_codon:yes stop_codon:yes gene_type:complete